MLREFYEFDRKFVHLTYRAVVSALDGKGAEPLSQNDQTGQAGRRRKVRKPQIKPPSPRARA